MAKTIIVAGFGPGISSAVAHRFGEAGFSVALVGRTADKLAAGAAALVAKGVKAAAFPADLGDPAAVRALVGKVRATFGAIDVLHWNAYGSGAGDLLQAAAADVRGVFDVPVGGLLTAIQECLPDLRKNGESAILVTNGGLGYFDPKIDAMAVEWGAMGLALANAAKHKMVGLLAAKLKPEGVYIGEVVVLAMVKGTAFDNGSATLETKAIAEKFWHLYTERKEHTTQIG
jgi:NAD(P)-dependent dehydrogenase (short-subunit alcohol dehydrogenase family)